MESPYKGFQRKPEGRNLSTDQVSAALCGEVGAPPGMLCDMAWYLQRCMEPLMYLKDDDILEASLLETTDNESGASPTLAEEAALLGEDPPSQEAQKTTACPADHQEETPKPKVRAQLEWAVTDPQAIQQQIPLPPVRFRLPTLMSGPPPLEVEEPPVRIPGEGQLDVTSLVSTEIIMIRNHQMGKFECHY